MMTSMILNVILCLGVIVMVVSPLAWAIRTSHRDHANVATSARHARGVTPARGSVRQGPAPQAGATSHGQAWPAS